MSKVTNSRLEVFLYLLVRDYMPAGNVSRAVKETLYQEDGHIYRLQDRGLALVAEELAERLRDSRRPGSPAFDRLGDLPPDVSEALESFKLSIIRHRADGFAECSASTFRLVISALLRFMDPVHES